MTEKYFISVEFRTPELVSSILPGSEKYRFDTLIAISDNFDSDIEAISISEKIVTGVKHPIKIDDKYNIKFFPGLPEEFTFGDPYIDEYETKDEFIEETLVVKRANFIDDEDEKIGQVAVLKKPIEHSLVEMMTENDRHFYKESVSKKHVLN